MPKVKINKQLDRPDGGKVASGSIAVCDNPQPIGESKAVVFRIAIYLNQTAIDSGKKPIPALDKFPKFKLVKQCTDTEWDALNDDAGAGALMATFMKECIDTVLGDGFTEIIV